MPKSNGEVAKERKQFNIEKMQGMVAVRREMEKRVMQMS